MDTNELEKVLDNDKIKVIEMAMWENPFNRRGMILDLIAHETTIFSMPSILPR